MGLKTRRSRRKEVLAGVAGGTSSYKYEQHGDDGEALHDENSLIHSASPGHASNIA